MTILLRDIWPVSAPENYELHFVRWNRKTQPLEVWVRSKQGWQEYRPAREEFWKRILLSRGEHGLNRN